MYSMFDNPWDDSTVGQITKPREIEKVPFGREVCPKCTTKRYRIRSGNSEGGFTIKYNKMEDMMVIACKTCDYSWLEYPADIQDGR